MSSKHNINLISIVIYLNNNREDSKYAAKEIIGICKCIQKSLKKKFLKFKKKKKKRK